MHCRFLKDKHLRMVDERREKLREALVRAQGTPQEHQATQAFNANEARETQIMRVCGCLLGAIA